jgi:4-amino-4-deoxy-L-arabinose transferase-like glycosyltransferase
VAGGLLLPSLGTAPLDDPGEGQHAEIAREVWAGRDWITLRLNGVRYFDKPPLLYWIGSLAFHLGGPGEWTARIGPALGALLAAMGTALLGARLLGPGWGVVAAGALLSSAFFLVYGRYTRPEALFVAAIQWGFTGLLLAQASRRRPWALAGGAALGFASLAKDPLGLIGPIAALAAARALGRRFRPVSAWLPPSALAVMLILGFGWYAAAGVLNSGFLWYTVVDNHLLNVARLRQFPDEDVPLSALEFIAVAGLGALPWVVPAALMIGLLARRRAWRDPAEEGWVALALWAAGVLLIFTVSPFKLPHYGLPAYPALALLAARWWRERGPVRPAMVLVVHALLFAVLAAGAALAARTDGRLLSDLILSTADVYSRNVAVLGESAPMPAWSAVRPTVERTALLWAMAAGALVVLATRRAWRAGLLVVLAAMLATMPAAAAVLGAFAASRSLAPLASELRAGLGPRDLLVHEGPIENSGALEFYSGRRPVLLEARRSVLGFGATYPEAAQTFWDADRFRREWLEGRSIFLLSPRLPARSVIASLPPETVEVVRAHNGRTLYRNVTLGPRGESSAASATRP